MSSRPSPDCKYPEVEIRLVECTTPWCREQIIQFQTAVWGQPPSHKRDLCQGDQDPARPEASGLGTGMATQYSPVLGRCVATHAAAAHARRLHVGAIERLPDPPEAGNLLTITGGTGGNRTLDPGIMSAVPWLPRLNRELIVDPKSLITLNL